MGSTQDRDKAGISTGADDRRLCTMEESDGYFNNQFSAHAISIFAGTHKCSSDKDVMFVTTLGSCISVCIHDPASGLGGMNHFMMPDEPRYALDSQAGFEKSTRYGLAAMEFLINDLMRHGVRKENMLFKIFGGASVIRSMSNIGEANIKFARDFLKNEGFAVECDDTGGFLGRRIHFFPATGKVMRRFLRRDVDMAILSREETIYRNSLKDKPMEGTLELF